MDAETVKLPLKSDNGFCYLIMGVININSQCFESSDETT